MEPRLSIIIPILNEAQILPTLLQDIDLCRRQLKFPVECIIVDGGSTDESVEICKQFEVKIVMGPRGRGQQLVAGVAEAGSQIFMFLHADCRLKSEHCRAALATVQNNGVVAGGFHLRFDDDHPILRFAEAVNRIRFRFTKIFYGDHAIFLRRENYEAAGGFSRQALFEDIDFSRRLKKLGQVTLISPALETSARRFRAGGVVRTYLKMATMHVLNWLHVSPNVLAKWYNLRSRD